VCLVAGAHEGLWYFDTGTFLVSNQHFFDHAKGQMPGSLKQVSFFSFRFISLLKEPFIGDATLYSYWTELFARVWFDYENRYLVPSNFTVWYGHLAYTNGILCFLAALADGKCMYPGRTIRSR
jgi:hypothetical protein